MKFEFDTSGLDKLQKDLGKLADNADNLDGTHSVSFDNLFPPTFMQKHTSSSNIDEFTKRSDFDWENMETISEKSLNSYVAKHTSFSNWDEMKAKAVELWTKDQLGL